MKVKTFDLPGLLLVEPKIFGDTRGFFLQSYNEPAYREAGIDCSFVQDNHSRSAKNVLRGLHFQSEPGQAKLVRVASGRIYDVAVDIRPDSPTFGQWESVILDAETHAQFFVPVGFAHGFCVLSDFADVLYKVSSPYEPVTETGFSYCDPDIGIPWPTETPIVSKRDENAQSFQELRQRLSRP